MALVVPVGLAVLVLVIAQRWDDDVSVSGSDDTRVASIPWVRGADVHLPGVHTAPEPVVLADGRWSVPCLAGACDVAPDLLVEEDLLVVRTRTRPPPFAGCRDVSVRHELRISSRNGRVPALHDAAVRVARS